ncbi:MAG: hypothetical protein BWY13_01234 [Euryarchaeota archaeon ADurb.Bin190]|nr:MAG: hypothetical protein BWY13_01234 [Euryarchaeota archaeon ADurb.Bin190]
MDLISGPRRGSTSGNILKGKTDSLTPKWGIFFSERAISARLFFIISSVAMLAMEMLQTLETRGTVREARGLASRT